ITGGNLSGSQLPSGSRSTGSLYNTTTFTLNAVGQTGQQVSQSVTVSVVQPQTCSINNFNASPSSVSSGNSATLSWSTSGCTNVTISGGTVSGSQSQSGSISTGALYNTTTYTLIATGSNGQSQSQSVTVSVNQQTCSISSFYASPSQVSSGNSSTIYWTTSGCTNATVSGPNVYSQQLSGSISTGPVYGSNTYTLTAYG